MPEPKRRAGDVAGKPRGVQALLGAAIAMVGALATVHPANALLAALGEAVPKLAEATRRPAAPTPLTAPSFSRRPATSAAPYPADHSSPPAAHRTP